MRIQYYEDKELTKLIEKPLDLGELKAGESRQYEYYVYNADMNPHKELQFSVDHKEVEVISAPSELKEKESAKIVLEWKASVDVKRGLKTSIKVEGYEVIG